MFGFGGSGRSQSLSTNVGAPSVQETGEEPVPETKAEDKKGYFIQREVDKFLRFAYATFEARGYAGSVEVEWKLGLYEESVQLMFERKENKVAPWAKARLMRARIQSVPVKIDGTSVEAGSELALRDRRLLSTMFQRLEDRAKDWITTKLREGEDADDLTGLPASRDPLLGTTASIGFSFFGVGWQISICVKCYLSRLRRWRCRAWELRVGADDWRDLFFDVAALGREEVGERSVVPNAKMPEDKPKDETIFVSGAALKKALETTPLFNDCFGGTPPSTDALRRAWHLCDLGRDDGLGRDEFALFVYLLRRLLVDNVKLPAYLASDLFPPRTKPRDASAPQETPPDTPPKAARKSPKPAETVDV